MTVEASTRSSYDIGEHSPCVGICDLDPVSGWCRGCARTGVEVHELGIDRRTQVVTRTR